MSIISTITSLFREEMTGEALDRSDKLQCLFEERKRVNRRVLKTLDKKGVEAIRQFAEKGK